MKLVRLECRKDLIMSEDEYLDITFLKGHSYVFVKKGTGYATIDETGDIHYMNKQSLKRYFKWKDSS